MGAAAGCGGRDAEDGAAVADTVSVEETETAGKISVVATIFPPYDFAREIAGDLADVAMLLPPGAESHSFEPTPKDILLVRDCDVFLYIGGESDAWVERILESTDTDSMIVLPLIDCVEAVEEVVVEGMQEEEGEEEEAELDEHIWTSPRNAALMARAIADALGAADARNAAAYAQNAARFESELEELDASFRDLTEKAARKTIVFGDRFPFRYFADAYGLEYFAAFPGCSTETEASAATVAFLIDKIKAERIPAVFFIELSNERMANAIGEATGAKPLLLHACHNISAADFESGANYLGLMRQNLVNLKEALQ
jgi:zinc transport system substrate-binding protein